MADVRVAKYAVDLASLATATAQAVTQMSRCTTGRCATSSGPAAIAKCTAEVRKLATWLQKHQDETLRDKSKLIEIAGSLFRLANIAHDCKNTEDEENLLIDQIVSVHETLISLPEGKLVNSAGKSKVLKSLEALRGMADKNEADESAAVDDGTAVTLWELLDVKSHAARNAAVLTVMEPSSGDDMEVEVVDDEGIVADLRQCFDDGTALTVQLEALTGGGTYSYRLRGYEPS